MNRLFALALVSAVCACSPAPQPAPAAPGTSQAAGAGNPQADATVAGIHLSAMLLPVATLPDNAITAYGITRKDDAQLLMISARDAAGNAIADDGLTVTARAGSLQNAPVPVSLRRIETNGMIDYIGVIDAAPPTTLRVQVQARKGGSSAQMTFSRDLR